MPTGDKETAIGKETGRTQVRTEGIRLKKSGNTKWKNEVDIRTLIFKLQA